MSAMAMAQAGLCPGTPVLDERFDFLDEIQSAGEDEAWIDSIHEWAASSGPGTKKKEKEKEKKASVMGPSFKRALVVPTIRAGARPQQGLVLAARRTFAAPFAVRVAARKSVGDTRAEAAALHLAEAKSASATTDERARALRAYQRLTMSAAEYRRTVAIPLRKEKRSRVDWEKMDRVMYYSRKAACHERKRTEMGTFVPKKKQQ